MCRYVCECFNWQLFQKKVNSKSGEAEQAVQLAKLEKFKNIAVDGDAESCFDVVNGALDEMFMLQLTCYVVLLVHMIVSTFKKTTTCHEIEIFKFGKWQSAQTRTRMLKTITHHIYEIQIENK